MAKVVTSEGLQDFINTGNPTEKIEPKAKLTLAKKLEAVDASVEPPKQPSNVVELSGEKEPPKEDDGLEPEDRDLAERAQKRIGKKHYEMKKAQEEAAKAREEAEADQRLAETLFNERELWKKRAEEAERRAAEAKPKEPEKVLVKPDVSKYYDDKGQFKLAEYTEAVSEWSAAKALEEDHKKQAEEAQKRAQAAAQAEMQARIARAEEKYGDWQKVVGGSEAWFPDAALRFLAKSEYGTDIAYFLAKNPKDAARFKTMDPDLAVAELGKLQTQFEKPANPPAPAASKTVEPETSVSRGAPAPITPISTSGTGTVQLDPAKMSFKELRAYERERARNRR